MFPYFIGVCGLLCLGVYSLILWVDWMFSGMDFKTFLHYKLKDYRATAGDLFADIFFPPSYKPQAQTDRPTSTGSQPTAPSWRSYVPFGVGNTIADFLIDPDKTCFEIFVAPGVLSRKDSKWIVLGRETYEKEAADGKVKLKVSGTGFIVYDHPDVPAGTWASCR